MLPPSVIRPRRVWMRERRRGREGTVRWITCGCDLHKFYRQTVCDGFFFIHTLSWHYSVQDSAALTLNQQPPRNPVTRNGMEQMLCPPMSCTASYPRMQIMFTLVPWRWFKFLSKPCVSQCQCWAVVVTRKEESITDAMQCIASEMPDHATRPNGEREKSNRKLFPIAVWLGGIVWEEEEVWDRFMDMYKYNNNTTERILANVHRMRNKSF